jgi:organic hydroperoxide reductase OsmC/OhrA
MEKEHHYSVSMVWTGNRGEGTRNYRAYDRDHILRVEGKADISASSDPSFLGSPSRYNPEELMVASLSSCHMLWYLHLCSVNHIVVTEYQDQAKGTMMEKADGSGYFREVELSPVITLTEENMIAKAKELHEEANRFCFIANSVNFPVKHKPLFKIAGRDAKIAGRDAVAP